MSHQQPPAGPPDHHQGQGYGQGHVPPVPPAPGAASPYPGGPAPYPGGPAPYPQSPPAGYGPVPGPPPGYPGQPGHPGYPGHPAQPYAPVPVTMPGVLRAAQVILFVAMGLAVVGVVVVSSLRGAEASGRMIGSILPLIGAFICALRFNSGGGGVRITAIVFTSLMILFGLGQAGNGDPSGLGWALFFATPVLVLLCLRPSSAWFDRPRQYG